jgi:hypothetical protein
MNYSVGGELLDNKRLKFCSTFLASHQMFASKLRLIYRKDELLQKIREFILEYLSSTEGCVA